MGESGKVGRRIGTGRALRALLVLAVTVGSAIGAGSAQAAEQVITSAGPLDNIYLSDSLMCNATYVGDTSAEFYPPTLPPDSSYPGSCGTTLATGGTLYGFLGTAYTLVSQSPVTGSGTAADPFTVVTVVDAGTTGLRITQTDSYVVGDERYRTDIAVSNSTGSPIDATIYHAGDCYLQGSDSGYGFYDPNSQGIFCTANPNNDPAARLLGFTPVTPGSNYIEDHYSTVFSSESASGTQFPNTCGCTIQQDNGAGLSWPITVPAGGVTTTSLFTTFSPSGSTTGTTTTTTTTPAATPPQNVAAAPPAVKTSTSANFSGSVNPGGLPTTAYFAYGLDAQYRAVLPSAPVYDQVTPTQNVGSDFADHTVSASPAQPLVPDAGYHVVLVAQNSAGTTVSPAQGFKTKQDPPPPPPKLGRTANLTPVSGHVFIKFPHAHAADPALASLFQTSALAKGSGFIPLTEARQVPVGAQVDSRLGTLNLATAAGARVGKQTGTFGGGLFSIGQDRTGLHKGLTTLSLLEGDFPGAPSYASCPGRRSADAQAHSARSFLQTLRARDNHGSFRTRGRYSAGTVRGTVWDTTDQCGATLTVVHRGSVDVTDFGKRKTVTVHAGHSYLARAIVARKHKRKHK